MSPRGVTPEAVLVAGLAAFLLLLYACCRDREFVRLAGEALAALYALLHISRRDSGKPGA